ncbi:MAG: YraN family protein [Planctomycetota bacterium]
MNRPRWKVRLRALVNRVVLNRMACRLIDAFKKTQPLGTLGELEAERYLLKAGMIVVGKGYSDLAGEIDLVAVDGRTIVFVEVKTRASDAAGSPEEAVDQEKQKRISRTAMSYLNHHELQECQVRFDVIAITWPTKSHTPQLVHYRSAFEYQR